MHGFLDLPSPYHDSETQQQQQQQQEQSYGLRKPSWCTLNLFRGDGTALKNDVELQDCVGSGMGGVEDPKPREVTLLWMVFLLLVVAVLLEGFIIFGSGKGEQCGC